MVTTATTYTDNRYRASPGEGFDGVVRVSVGGSYGTGVLLYDGRAVLTAAHLWAQGGGAASVVLETAMGTQTLSAGLRLVHPDYDAANTGNDLALLWLGSAAPAAAGRHTLYRHSDEIGQAFTLVGYGQPGTGSAGAQVLGGSPLRLKAQNTFDADSATLKLFLGAGMAWSPPPGTQLMADFDNGSTDQDALGRLVYRSGKGLGIDEGLLAPGDSGGPAFINGKVAGIASYTASLSYGNVRPDVDTVANSSFGEVAAWQRVSHYQQWIDQSVRARYPDAPVRPDEVKKTVPEGHAGNSYAYFLLQFTGVRSDPDQWLSVDYATRDGTARGGEDYLPGSGTLILYPGELQAVIAVEVLGDTRPEPAENFYLDVFNPVGGSFGDGVVQLTAVRTIVDDDGWLG